VQLVLQASTLNESNAIFLLEMGDPIKIIDLAKNLIELSGLKVGEDIELKITGMRPGEKIEEVLLSEMENVVKTRFDKIRVQNNLMRDPDRVDRFIHDLKSNVELGNIRAIHTDLMELVPEMTGPSFEELSANMFA
jgi:FlaA1/EpsC-like NDP-sugar epimerase